MGKENLSSFVEKNTKEWNIENKKQWNIEYREVEKQLKEETILNKLDLIYDMLKNNKNVSNEIKDIKNYLENEYFELTGFPVPYNENWEMFTPLD